MSNSNYTQEDRWYPLRITYSRELKVKEYLDTQGIENFIPMHYEERGKEEKKEQKYVPVVHNLIFVRASRKLIESIKSDSPFASCIRYMMHLETHAPITIPEKQMNDFIAVSQKNNEPVMYLDPVLASMKKGDWVRIKSGIWQGVEGKFVRIKRGLRVVVAIEGVMAVATTSVHPSAVEIIHKIQL